MSGRHHHGEYSAVNDYADDVAYLAGLRERLALPGIVDVHTHFMPESVMNKVWAYFDSAGPLVGRPWPITYRDEEQVRLKTLRAFGVRAFTALVYPHKPDMAAWLNGWTAEFAAATPDCLHTATFYPEPTAADYVATAIERGARVFKVHIQVGDFAPNDPLLTPVWGLIAEAGVPVVIHCGSGPAPGRFTGPEPIAELLGRFPGLRLIVAHMGTPEYSEFLDLAERHPTVSLDTTMAWTDFCEQDAPYPRAEYGRLRALSDRILFGSDFPNIPYSYTHAVRAVERLDLGADWQRKVFWENGARMFGLV
ncbi:MAG TPA: amidohydrolase family protein [Nocardia sp.]|uniref:amidohydrolase family protein n=1 Tax=Nocardia TaxID=1817 RepID=UPI002457D2F3|nr:MULTISPECIES: amidohydrolase family protein [Nocardia]HLS79132.1 amidohydrolase family protein [Nocardia sp.]